jgi:uncharacterized protein (DUF433 family)
MDYRKYTERNPNVRLGKPDLKGTRITVELLIRKLAGGYSMDDIILNYPHLDKTQIMAVLE